MHLDNLIICNILIWLHSATFKKISFVNKNNIYDNFGRVYRAWYGYAVLRRDRRCCWKLYGKYIKWIMLWMFHMCLRGFLFLSQFKVHLWISLVAASLMIWWKPSCHWTEDYQKMVSQIVFTHGFIKLQLGSVWYMEITLRKTLWCCCCAMHLQYRIG